MLHVGHHGPAEGAVLTHGGLVASTLSWIHEMRSGGENVYPAEVERVLREHDAVADVAVDELPRNAAGKVLKRRLRELVS